MKFLALLLLFCSGAAHATVHTLMLPALRNPIVLVHGATMKGSSLDIGPLHYGEYFKDLPRYLGESGTPVKVVELTTDSSIGERAAVLNNFIQTTFEPGQKVNLICHSLGGLDARYLVSVMGGDRYVASITTIGTPHHGTPLADWGVKQRDGGTLWYWIFRLLGYDLKQRRFLPELSTESMETKFNPKVPNVYGVKYFSVQTRASFGQRTLSYLMWFTTHWMESENSPMLANGHDGLVPFDSQAWGEVVGQVDGLDHLGQINHNAWRGTDETDTAYQTWRTIYARLVKEGL